MGSEQPPGRRIQNLVGYGAILVAASWALYNIGAEIQHLKDWDGVYDPSFIGPMLKEFGKVLLAACGGKVLPQWQLTTEEKADRIDDPSRFAST